MSLFPQGLTTFGLFFAMFTTLATPIPGVHVSGKCGSSRLHDDVQNGDPGDIGPGDIACC